MEIRDLNSDVEMEAVRGGNSIYQDSYNGPVTGAVIVAPGFSNGSPNTVSSVVSQANVTQQAAAIHDIDRTDLSVSFVGSQLFAGFPFLAN